MSPIDFHTALALNTSLSARGQHIAFVVVRGVGQRLSCVLAFLGGFYEGGLRGVFCNRYLSDCPQEWPSEEIRT